MAGDIWGDGNLLVPHTLVASDAGVVQSTPPLTLLAGMDGTSATLPPLTISASASFIDFMAASLPAYLLDADLNPGSVTAGDSSFPIYDISATIISGAVSDALNDLPPHSLVADFGWFSQNELPVHTLDALVSVGEVIVGDLTLPAYTLSTTVSTPLSMSGANNLPVYVLSAGMTSTGLAQAVLLLPAHELTATGLTGEVLRAANNLPVYVLVADAYAAYTLSGVNNLPIHQLTARMSQAVTAAFRAWALNLRNRALTEYTNFSFNSFASFGGKVYAAGPAGIFELGTQDADDTAAIDASLRTGKHNFGTTYAKRIPRIYLGHHAMGDLEFRTMTGEGGTRGYLLPWNEVTDLQQRRIPVGRGPKSVYWQFEVVNRNGAQFDLDNLQAYPEGSKRRVAP